MRRGLCAIRAAGAREALVIAVAAGMSLGAVNGTALARGDSNWPSYLHGPEHWSYSPGEKAIRPGNVADLVRQWRFRGDRATRRGQPVSGFLASPTVAGGVVYIGAATGWFYKLSAARGTVLAKRFIGYQPPRTCGPRGFVATATVATDRVDGERMVYAAGPDGMLYAMAASDLSVRWRSVIARPSRRVSDYFQWSSPTVANGRIYVGVSSNCDRPLVPGGLIAYNQHTGRKIAAFHTRRHGLRGGSVWSSAAVGPDRDVYVTTGNSGKGRGEAGYSDSIVKLSPRTLRPLASFAVPPAQVIPDGDFGASPTIFGRYVGACNKNGIFYALHRSTMRLAWSRRVGASAPAHGISNCSAAAVYDGRSLYVAGDATTIGGRSHRGSVQRLNPRTGAVLWRAGLPDGVIGTPTLDGGGVIAVGTYDFSPVPNAIYLLDARSGAIVRTLLKGSDDFAQAVFAGGRLFTANGNGLSAWSLRRTRHRHSRLTG